MRKKVKRGAGWNWEMTNKKEGKEQRDFRKKLLR